jgi:hypothetical protein
VSTDSRSLPVLFACTSYERCNAWFDGNVANSHSIRCGLLTGSGVVLLVNCARLCAISDNATRETIACAAAHFYNRTDRSALGGASFLLTAAGALPEDSPFHTETSGNTWHRACNDDLTHSEGYFVQPAAGAFKVNLVPVGIQWRPDI